MVLNLNRILGFVLFSLLFAKQAAAQFIITDTTFVACDSLRFKLGIEPQEGFTYEWSPSTFLTDPDSNFTFALLENNSPNEATLFEYSLNSYNPSGQLVAQRRYDIYVLQFSQFITNLGEFPLCAGDSLLLNPPPGAPGGLIIEPAELGLVKENGQLLLFPSDTTNFQISSIDSFYCGKIIYNLRVDVRAVQQASILTPPSRLCNGNSSDSLFIETFPTGGLLVGAGVLNDNLFSATIAGIGVHQLIYYSFQNSCLSTDTTTIEVIGPSSVTLSGPPNLCQTDSVINLAYGTPNGGTYFIDGIESITINPSLLASGNHELIYVYEWDSTCIFEKQKPFFIIPLPPQPIIESTDEDYLLCTGDSIRLNINTFTGFGWSNGVVNETSLTITDSIDSLYAWFRSNTGCYSYSDTVNVLFASPATIELSSPPYNNGLEISSFGANDGRIEVDLSGGFAPFDLNLSPEMGILNNQSYSNLGPDLYYITIEDSAGCVAMDSIIIREPDSVVIDVDNVELLIPNAFTPNGDGFNDLYVIRGMMPDHVENEFYVFDFRRQLVYSAQNYSNTWNGTDNKGNRLLTGTYYGVFKSKGLEKPFTTVIDLRYE
jgi:gliding motility-associated-like protein